MAAGTRPPDDFLRAWKLDEEPEPEPPRARELSTFGEMIQAATVAVEAVDRERLNRAINFLEEEAYLPTTSIFSPGVGNNTYSWRELSKVSDTWSPAVLTERRGHAPHSRAAFDAFCQSAFEELLFGRNVR